MSRPVFNSARCSSLSGGAAPHVMLQAQQCSSSIGIQACPLIGSPAPQKSSKTNDGAPCPDLAISRSECTGHTHIGGHHPLRACPRLVGLCQAATMCANVSWRIYAAPLSYRYQTVKAIAATGVEV